MSIIIILLGIISAVLYTGQLISVVKYSLAQRLGLKAHPGNVEPLHDVLEKNAARWDVLWIWTVPVAYLLLALTHHHPWGAYLGLVGGGALVDAGGREAAKFHALVSRKVRVGDRWEIRTGFATFAFLVALGMALIAISLDRLMRLLGGA